MNEKVSPTKIAYINLQRHNEEIGDDQEEEKQLRQIPNSLEITRKGVQEILKHSPKAVNKPIAILSRITRCKSPNNLMKIASLKSQLTRKNLSPVGLSKKIPCFSPSKKLDLTIENDSSKFKNKTANKSPTSLNRSQEKYNKDSKSPRQVKGIQLFKPEQEQALKNLARKKRKLNQELWNAASNGDVITINRLLEPYFSQNINE